ncbi:MAG: hypothetical protein K2J73_02600 [Oscillospiraceae bacterium]|nr:hypothetical protein [Oscillospiraceae bacterium]
MNENEMEEVSPEEFTKLYMSMNTEERELFWKMFSEEIKRLHENQSSSDNSD